jgi:hypothetical protein
MRIISFTVLGIDIFEGELLKYTGLVVGAAILAYVLLR